MCANESRSCWKWNFETGHLCLLRWGKRKSAHVYEAVIFAARKERQWNDLLSSDQMTPGLYTAVYTVRCGGRRKRVVLKLKVLLFRGVPRNGTARAAVLQTGVRGAGAECRGEGVLARPHAQKSPHGAPGQGALLALWTSQLRLVKMCKMI